MEDGGCGEDTFSVAAGPVTMTRPSSASFAQFFPAAPRAARDRAIEREKEKARKEALESPSSALADKTTLSRQHPPSAADRPADPALATSRREPSVSDPSHTPADDIDSFRVDIPNTVGSESSHTSIASSVANSSVRTNGVAVTKNASLSHLTPLTSIDSPSPTVAPPSTKPDTSTDSYLNNSNAPSLKPDASSDSATAVDPSNISYRPPARDPSLRVQVIKATFDAVVDRSSRDKKKPRYKEFGLVRKHIKYSARLGERHLLICGNFG